MNVKNRLIEKLLKVAKKHKILTYPVLALVAIISVFSYLFDWSTGAGKRVVAVLMVMVMLVSQSYFLTSSATENIDTTETMEEQAELAQAEEEKQEAEEASGENIGEEATSEEAIADDKKKETTEEVSTEDKTSEESDGMEEATETVSSEEGSSADSSEIATSANAEQSVETPVAGAAEDPAQETSSEDPTDVTDQVTVNFYRIMGISGMGTGMQRFAVYPDSNTVKVTDNLNDTYTITVAGANTALAANNDANGCYIYEGWYDAEEDGNKVTSAGNVNEVVVPAANTINLYAYYKLMKYRVTVNPDANRTSNCTSTAAIQGAITVNSTTQQVTPGNIYDFYVDVPASGADITVEMSLPRKKGYSLSSVVVNNTVISDYTEDSISATINGTDAYQTIDLNWQPKQYTVYYAQSDAADANLWPKDVTYDSETVFGVNDIPSVATAKPGFKFVEWKLSAETYNGGDSFSATARDALYDAYVNEDISVHFIPTYTHINVALTKTSADFQYKKPLAKAEAYSIEAEYTDGTVDPEQDRGFKLELDTSGDTSKEALKTNYDVTAEVSADGTKILIYSENGPKEKGSQHLTGYICDLNLAETDPDYRTAFDITVTIGKRIVHVLSDTGETIFKTYDGTTFCKSLLGKTLPTDVTVGGTNITVQVGNNESDALYEDANAGTNKKIKLTNCTLSANFDPNYYQLEGSEGGDGNAIVYGNIDKRPVYYKTKVTYLYGRNYVLTGESANPQLSVVYDDENNTGDAGNSGFIAADNMDITECMNAYVEGRDDAAQAAAKTATKNYEVKAKPTGNDVAKNYRFSYISDDEQSALASFEVRLETPILDTHYVINGTPVFDNWYNASGSIQLKNPSDSYYNGFETGDDSFTSALNFDEDTQVDAEGKIKFRLKNSITGAYSAYITENIKVDTTSPEFTGYSLKIGEDAQTTEGNFSTEGLYFPSEGETVSFGNYFNKTVTFTIWFKDTLSGAKTLHYRLNGTLGQGHGNTTTSTDTAFSGALETPFWSQEGSNTAYASFTIPEAMVVGSSYDKIGSIELKGEDKVGNKSGIITLRRDMKSDTDSGTWSEDSPSEWAVEKTGPENVSLSLTGKVFSNDGTAVDSNFTDSTNYHAGVVAHIAATEATSGIRRVTWNVNGTEYVVDNTDLSKKITSLPEDDATLGNLAISGNSSFTPSVSSDGKDGYYHITGYVTDNAGNNSESVEAEFYVDDVAPMLDVRYTDSYQQSATVDVTIYDILSGIDTWGYYTPDGIFTLEGIEGETRTYNETLGCYVTTATIRIDESGTYKIQVKDKAGNMATKEIELTRVSSSQPDCPEVTLPEENENGWIRDVAVNEPAKVIIGNVTKTNDAVPVDVDTYYMTYTNPEDAWRPGASVIPSYDESKEIELTREGTIYLDVWSVSRTGVYCEDADASNAHSYTLHVDRLAPEIESAVTRSGDEKLIISFTVTDSVSGVDGETIQVLYNGEPLDVTKWSCKAADGTNTVYEGSFTVDKIGEYTIVAKDLAGNESVTEGFTPMRMSVSAIKNITDTGAMVGAKIIAGTADITGASIEYCKVSEYPAGYHSVSALTVPDGRNQTISAELTDLEEGTEYVYKITATSAQNEILEYEGYFRTLSDTDEGASVYGIVQYGESAVSPTGGKVTVGLYSGKQCVRALEVDTTEPYIDYNFVFESVADGTYNVVATDGTFSKQRRVVITDGAVEYPEDSIVVLTLSANSTGVEIVEDGDGDIYKYVVVDNLEEIFNEAPDYILNYGSEEDLTLIADGGNIEFRLYSSIIKMNYEDNPDGVIVRDYIGNKLVGAYLDLTIEKIKRDEYGNEISRTPVHTIQTPLQITIPLGDFANKKDVAVVRVHDGIPQILADIDANRSTYTISTDRFSTYAIVYSPEEEPTEDTETQAPTTEEPKTEQPSTGTPSNPNTPTVVPGGTVTAPTASEDKKTNAKKKTSKSDADSVGTLTSASNAKTGDETPIAILGGMMLIALGGIFVLRKKYKE